MTYIKYLYCAFYHLNPNLQPDHDRPAFNHRVHVKIAPRRGIHPVSEKVRVFSADAY